MLVAVGGDGSNLCNLGASGDIALVCLEVLHDGLDGGLGSPAEIHWVASGSNVLDGLGKDGPGENGGRCGSVTSSLVGLRRDVLEKASAEVLELVLESDGPRNGNTI